MYSFSSNSGTDWSSPTVVSGCSNVYISSSQSGSDSGPGPTPVVASFLGMSGQEPDFLLVYAANEGLHFRYTPNYNTPWVTPGNDIIPGATSSTTWYPCLSTYNSRDYYLGYHQVNLIYDQRYNHVYSQTFKYNGSISWSTRQQVSATGTSNNRYSSLALDDSYYRYAVWSGQPGSYFTIKFRSGFPDSWGSWWNEWSIPNVHCYTPAISCYGIPDHNLDILFYTSTNQVRQKKFVGDQWVPSGSSTQVIASSSLCANLTHERFDTGVPKQVWSDQSTGKIYSMPINSIGLSKESPLAYGEIRRAVEIGDSTNNTGLRIEFNQPIIKLNDGDSLFVPFKKYDYKEKLSLSLKNVFDYLQTEPIDVPENAESISCKVLIKTIEPDTLNDGTINKNRLTYFKDISLNLLVNDYASKKDLDVLGNLYLNNEKGLHNFIKSYKIDGKTFNKKTIFIIPKVNLNGEFKEKDLSFLLGNVYIEDSALVSKGSTITLNNNLPDEYILNGNYPNPFNPATKISYNLPRTSSVEIEIFDILGKKVKSFTFFSQSAGKQGVIWNGTNSNNQQVASGIYLYHFKAVSLEGKKEVFEKTAKLLLLK